MLAQLTPQRVFLILNTDLKSIGVKPTQREKWMAIDYAIESHSARIDAETDKSHPRPISRHT